jgi:hypothetical protein
MVFVIINCLINLKSSGFQYKHPKKKAKKFKVTVLNLQFHTLIVWSIYCKFCYKISNFDTLDSQGFALISQICYGYD